MAFPAMPTSPIPSQPVKFKRAPTLNVFAVAGQEDRNTDGINAKDVVAVDLTWQTLTFTDKETIMNFFIAQGGTGRFTYTIQVLYGGFTATWICKKFGASLDAAQAWSVRATLERRFDLV